ncbi:MAG: MlaD family protein [Pseudomonas sp.]
METRAHHVLIGLFTLLAAAAAIFFAIWLSNASTSTDYRHYTVVFNQAVTGLSRGSAVQYSGIKVGDITALSLDPQDPRRVLASIRVEAGVPIKEDTRARLSFTGITGNSVIELSHGDPASPQLTARNGEDPIIVASPSPIAALLADGEDLLTNINQLISSVRSVLSEDNANSLTRTLEAMEKATTSFADQSESAGDLIAELTKASTQATIAMEQAAVLMGNADQLLVQQGARTLDGAEEAMTSIARSSAKLEALLDENSEAFTSGMQGLGQLEPAINELRGSLGSLRGITRRLEDNPTRFLLGRDSMEEFQP